MMKMAVSPGQSGRVDYVSDDVIFLVVGRHRADGDVHAAGSFFDREVGLQFNFPSTRFETLTINRFRVRKLRNLGMGICAAIS